MSTTLERQHGEERSPTTPGRGGPRRGKGSWLPLGLGLVVGLAFGWGLFALGLRDPNEGSVGQVPEATVVLNAFHWGWVPEVLEPGPGVRAEIAPGAQGSRIFVPVGTRLTLVVRNAAGNPDLHERYEERFAPFFQEKYGEAWKIAHSAAHDEMNPQGTGEHETSVLDHSFFLEGYDVEVLIPHEPEENVKVIQLTVDRTGEFRFLCTNFCGVGHADMTGTLVVFKGNRP